jgi:hypothetical protein
MEPMKNLHSTKRLVGLSLVLLGAAIFMIAGFELARHSTNGSCDFGPVYYPSRFLVQQQDPYINIPARFVDLKAHGYLDPNSTTPADLFYLPCVYPPTALFVAAPLALLRWSSANFIWMTISAASLVTGALLIWALAADFAPLLAGGLISFILINSITVLFEANAACLAVGLCAVAVALFLKDRLPALAIICLAVSLCLKPHDAGLVWLFLLFSGGVLRARALQTLFAVALLAAPAVLWVSHVSPNWPQKMSANISNLSALGGINDPGPTTYTNHVTNIAVNLQTIFAVLLNRPSFYNAATYIVCTLLLICLVWVTFRTRRTVAHTYLGLAAVSALSMLPVYHRHHDARLLLLAVPACAVLWAERYFAGRIGILIAFLAIALTGDIPRAILENLEAGHRFAASDLGSKVQMIVFNRPAALALLIMTLFFLWLYTRPVRQTGHQDPEELEMGVVQLG